MFVQEKNLHSSSFSQIPFFFNCFATKKDSIDFMIPTKTLTKLTVRPQRCCATTRLKHGVMDWRPESIEWWWRGVFYKYIYTHWGADKMKLQLLWQEAPPPPAGVLITKTEIDDWGGGVYKNTHHQFISPHPCLGLWPGRWKPGTPPGLNEKKPSPTRPTEVFFLTGRATVWTPGSAGQPERCRHLVVT